jgi:chemotaxis protein MotB
MARKKKHEEHVNAEAWAIPYGDLITLLLAFFVVMYSMSSVNEGKYRILSDSLVAAFRGAPSSPAPINVGEAAKGKGGDAQLSGVSPTALLKLRDPRPLPAADDPSKHGNGNGNGNGAGAEPGRQREALYYMAEEVRKALQSLIDQQMVRIRQSALTLEVEIKTDILFASGIATVDAQAVPVIEKVAGILAPFPNAIRVEGHTDNRPISTALFPSNWELSAARAANVVQLFTRSGIDPRRMEVLGLGDNRPVADNATLDGRNANRRVVIVVQAPGADAAVAGATGAGSAAPSPDSSPAPLTAANPAPTPTTPALTSPSSTRAAAVTAAAVPAAGVARTEPTVLARNGGTPP